MIGDQLSVIGEQGDQSCEKISKLETCPEQSRRIRNSKQIANSNKPMFQTSFNFFGSIPRNLLRNGNSWSSQSPSFPHAFSGDPGEILAGPPIETFGGDDFRGISSRFVDTPQLAAGVVHYPLFEFRSFGFVSDFVLRNSDLIFS